LVETIMAVLAEAEAGGWLDEQQQKVSANP
jgi:hypothetical protein